MNNVDIVIIPYRDIYFWQKYGSAVRDLQVLELIVGMNYFDELIVINRPVSIYERIFLKKELKQKYAGVRVIDQTSYDLLGPLKRRAWTRHCYEKLLASVVEQYVGTKRNLVVLDYSPFFIPIMPRLHNVIFWYDMIDNFTKHNRFSELEKALVSSKYEFVSNNYQVVTAVTQEALEFIPYGNANLDRYVVANGIFMSKFESEPKKIGKALYDFGFIGFITNKFDVDFVVNLSSKYSVIVYGESFDNSVIARLKMAGVVTMGGFKYSELPSIMKTFKVGLLPYLAEKSHDGSPLKMYEYLKHNRPCVTTITYEYEGLYVVNANKALDFQGEIKRLMSVSDSSMISESLPDEIYLRTKLYQVVKRVLSRFNLLDHPFEG